jgi:AcrR family transcriptional regulator
MNATAEAVVSRQGRGMRERILEAADRIARDSGPANVALDAVAASAGVSKGGLLYHFPSKQALLAALVDRHVERFEVEMAERCAAADGPGGHLQAYLDASLEDCRQIPPTGALAAMVQMPELLRPVRDFKRRSLDRMLASAANPGIALVLFLAMDGLRSMKLFDLDVLTPEERLAAIEALRRMIGVA